MPGVTPPPTEPSSAVVGRHTSEKGRQRSCWCKLVTRQQQYYLQLQDDLGHETGCIRRHSGCHPLEAAALQAVEAPCCCLALLPTVVLQAAPRAPLQAVPSLSGEERKRLTATSVLKGNNFYYFHFSCSDTITATLLKRQPPSWENTPATPEYTLGQAVVTEQGPEGAADQVDERLRGEQHVSAFHRLGCRSLRQDEHKLAKTSNTA